MITAKEFYRALVAMQQQVEQALQEAEINKQLGVVIYMGKQYSGDEGPEIRIEISYPGPKSEVIGKDFEQMTGELVRRHQFAEGQKNLQLERPVIEHQAPPIPRSHLARALDDEIPF